MTRKMRRRALAGAGVVALVLGGASMAWACTRSPNIYLSPSFGAAGSQTQVNGGSFLPGEPVEIRWNSKDGPVIGHATPGANYSFSVAVVIPSKAPDGVYYIVATAPASRAQASFQVGSRVSRSSDPEPRPEPNTSASGSGSEATSSNGGGQTSGSTAGGSGSSFGAGQQSGDLGFAEQPQNGSQATAAPAAQTASSANQATQPATGRAGAPAGGAVSTGESATGPGRAAAPAPTPGDEERSPTPRSATADLWSGFSSANTASLAPGLDNPAPASTGTTPMALGVALLSAGMAALGLGFGAAELRRKRVLAGRDA